MSRDLDMDLLRAFVAVADSGGFTRAARRLNRTQSAVSMQIRRLEDAAAAKLFVRNGHGIRLSPEGESLLGYARRILAIADEAVQRLADGQLAGSVRLGVMDDYATAVLPAVLGPFLAAHPHVYVEVHTGLTGPMLDRLGREHDLVLAMHPAGSGRGETLRQEQAVWAASPSAAPLDRTPLPLALYPQGCLFRDWALAALDAAGRRWRIAYMSPSLGAVEAAAAAGLAVTVTKLGTLPGSLSAVAPEAGLPPLPMAEIALHRAAGRESRAVGALAEHLRQSLSGPG